MWYLVLFLGAFSLSTFLTRGIITLAFRWNILDHPRGGRKTHPVSTPLWGGLGIFGALVASFFIALFFSGDVLPVMVDMEVELSHIVGIFLGGLVLVVGGALDDRFDLSPWQQLIFPFLAVLLVVSSGVGVTEITNPFGGLIYLDQVKLYLFSWQGVPRYFSVWSDMLTFSWLLLVMYTTKFLDGLDGLVSGMTMIGAGLIAILSLFFFISMPTAVLAVLVAGVYAGFLVWNFNPAKIFLGEGGSILAGFLLGCLAIISGAKVATTVLILGIPIFDALLVICRRVFVARRSPFQADRTHIHFRLLDAGFSPRQAVSVLYVLALAFGVGALFLQSAQKLVGIGVLAVVMIIFISFLVWRSRRVSASS